MYPPYPQKNNYYYESSKKIWLIYNGKNWVEWDIKKSISDYTNRLNNRLYRN